MPIYYVSTTGSDSNVGSFEQPWGTWQKAFETADAGDTVYFRGGNGSQGHNGGASSFPTDSWGGGGSATGNPGDVNTGGGGASNASGGSGIFKIRYFTTDFPSASGGSATVDGDYTIRTFTSSEDLILA